MIQFSDILRVRGFNEYNLVLEQYRFVGGKEGTRKEWCFVGYYPDLKWLLDNSNEGLKQKYPEDYGWLNSSSLKLIVSVLKEVNLSEETKRLKSEVAQREWNPEHMKAMQDKRKSLGV